MFHGQITFYVRVGKRLGPRLDCDTVKGVVSRYWCRGVATALRSDREETRNQHAAYRRLGKLVAEAPPVKRLPLPIPAWPRMEIQGQVGVLVQRATC